jgi:pilus assembly protein CpaD
MKFSHALKASIVLAGLSLAGCSSAFNGPEASYDPDTRFPITVEPHMETLRVAYDGGNAAASDNYDLRHFAQDYLDHGSGSIAVSASPRFPDAPADYAQRLIALGVPGNKILVGSSDAAAGDEIKLTYIRYQARTEPCGDWSVNLGDTQTNTASPNLGCATHQNIAAMVADPRDLVAPRPLEEDDAQRRLTVLQKYRKGETTVATKTAAQSGAISDVGGGGGGGGM